MISRVRLEAYGLTAAECEKTLLEAASKIDAPNGDGKACAYGEQVIERNLAEPYGSPFAFKGRLTLHPDIGRDFSPLAVPTATTGTNYTFNTTSSG